MYLCIQTASKKLSEMSDLRTLFQNAAVSNNSMIKLEPRSEDLIPLMYNESVGKYRFFREKIGTSKNLASVTKAYTDFKNSVNKLFSEGISGIMQSNMDRFIREADEIYSNFMAASQK